MAEPSQIRKPELAEIPGDYQWRALQAGFRVQRFWHRYKLELLSELHRRDGASRLLEIGCGSGNLLFHVASDYDSVHGIDVSRAAISFCRRRAAETGLGKALFCVGSAYDLPYCSECFGLVVLCEVLEHLEHPADCLREAWRVLRPNGRLIVTAPNQRSAWPLVEWFADCLGLTAKMRGHQHITQFTAASLRRCLSLAGFSVERMGTIYALSPLAAAVSPRAADWLFRRELAGLALPGAMLFCVARRAALR